MKADERIKIILMQDAAADTLRRLGAPPPARSCLRCEFLADDNFCGHWCLPVPREHISEGCEKFAEFIPF